MNKPEFIDVLSANLTEAKGERVTKLDTELFLNTMLQTIKETLADGEDIKFLGFGQFNVVQRAERVGTHPKTSEQITIPASRVVKFKVGTDLKNAVAEVK